MYLIGRVLPSRSKGLGLIHSTVKEEVWLMRSFDMVFCNLSDISSYLVDSSKAM